MVDFIHAQVHPRAISLRLLPAKTEYDSGAIPEIVLPVIGVVSMG